MEIESLLGVQSKVTKDVIRVQFETTYSIFAKHRCIIYVCIPPSHTQKGAKSVIHPTVGCHGDASSGKEILEFGTKRSCNRVECFGTCQVCCNRRHDDVTSSDGRTKAQQMILNSKTGSLKRPITRKILITISPWELLRNSNRQMI